jgi:DNA polymerase III subunit gamma/tau
MTDSKVIARKFRPQSFGEVVGQEAITRTLRNALTNQDRLHHAYLFTGARGVGKTTTARILAKALNCAKGITVEPCNQCGSCLDIAASRSIDVLEIDAASNTSVENVREVIISSISIAPAAGRYKIFIIDEVHMLSGAAFNALLKTVEEPPPRVMFILATTELQKVPDTILSRCQVFEFRTIGLSKIVDQLRQIGAALGIEISDPALFTIARAGEGSMRDAESALDQVISFAGRKVTDEDVSAALGMVDVETLNATMETIARQDSRRLIEIIDQVVARGYSLRNFCREMMVHVRGLLVVKVCGFDPELVQLPSSEGDAFIRLAEQFSEQDLIRFFSVLTKTEQDIRQSSQPRFQLEIGLMKLVQAKRLYLVEDALTTLSQIQSSLASGGAASGTSTKPPAKATEPRVEEKGTGFSSRPVSTPSAPAARVTSQRSASRIVKQADDFPPEPPPFLDDPFEDADPVPARGRTSPADKPAVASDGPVEKIKAALEGKRKMMLVTHLDRADVRVDGDFVRVAFPPEHAALKDEISSRDKRQAIEEACYEATGRRLKLVVVGQSDSDSEEKPVQSASSNHSSAENNPKVKAIKEKFHGEVVEVINPKS